MTDQPASEPMATSKTPRRPHALRTIKSTLRSEEVRRQLERAILDGDFEPGDRLPSERELVATFGVSRVSVREAIRSLEALGLVRVYQGRGAFVSDRRSGYGEPLGRWLALHKDEALELLAVRGALDEFAAQQAVEGSNEKRIDEVVRSQEAFDAAVLRGADVDELTKLDTDFHIALAEASGNRLLFDLLRDLHTYLAESRQAALGPPGRPAASAAEHGKIVRAVVAGDAIRARKAVRDHITSVRTILEAAKAESADGMGSR